MFSRRYVIEIILANELLKVGGDADVVVNRVEMRLNGVDARVDRHVANCAEGRRQALVAVHISLPGLELRQKVCK